MKTSTSISRPKVEIHIQLSELQCAALLFALLALGGLPLVLVLTLL